MHRPSPDIYAGELIDLNYKVMADLKRLAGTSQHLAPYIGNGHAGWEAANTNMLAPGDKALVAAIEDRSSYRFASWTYTIPDSDKGKAYTYKPDGTGKFTEGDIPADLAGEAESAKEALVEAAVEMDDELMEKYFPIAVAVVFIAIILIWVLKKVRNYKKWIGEVKCYVERH